MLPMLMTPKQILNLWDMIHSNEGDIDGIIISDQVKESWARSKAYHVDPYANKCDDILPQQALKEKLEQNAELLSVATPHMELLLATVKNAGVCITLCDNEGNILKRAGGQAELDFTAYSNFVEGSNWSERVMGTNAVGMALVNSEPSQVFGFEHFCKCACLSACTAAPIKNAAGEILGVLDLTGPYRCINPHTHGMVVAAARSIEREMTLNRIHSELRDFSLLRRAVIESASEGIIVLDSSSRILLINPLARKTLDIASDCTNCRISHVLPQDNPCFFGMLASARAVRGKSLDVETLLGKKRIMADCVPLLGNGQSVIGNVVTFRESREAPAAISVIRRGATFDSIVGVSSVLKDAVEQAKAAAENDSNVLLTGESGVGKDLFAKAIHSSSSRRGGPFFPVNCAAIPKELIFSELFGYNEGAFTGACKGGKPGMFELASRGTLFLDEIGEMPMSLQASLLRVLEEKLIMRVGGREYVPVDIRLISATNRDLLEEIKNRNFRLDIFYRLSVISIAIPPLRKRRGDIPLLAEHFLGRFAESMGKGALRIETAAMDALMGYGWPGNVRELSNVMERAAALAKGDAVTLGLLSREIVGDGGKNGETAWGGAATLDDMEEYMIQTYMKRFEGNKAKVAAAMNISRSSLYRKLGKYGLE